MFGLSGIILTAVIGGLVLLWGLRLLCFFAGCALANVADSSPLKWIPMVSGGYVVQVALLVLLMALFASVGGDNLALRWTVAVTLNVVCIGFLMALAYWLVLPTRPGKGMLVALFEQLLTGLAVLLLAMVGMVILAIYQVA